MGQGYGVQSLRSSRQSKNDRPFGVAPNPSIAQGRLRRGAWGGGEVDV